MFKREIAEIKKTMSPQECNISRIRGCCVNGEKEILSSFGDTFLSLPEEEVFKYYEIFKKTLSGKIGKNVHNLDIPLAAEKEDGEQEFMMRLRKSELKDDELVEEFFQNIIDTYDIVGNYAIILAYGSYDIPGKTSDNATLNDASDEVFRYLLCSICPMSLDKPGLAYNEEAKTVENRKRSWNVEMPTHGFLFPAFNDRSTDIHAALCYTKKSIDKQTVFFRTTFGATIPESAEEQKQMFETVVEKTFGAAPEFAFVKSVNDNLARITEEKKDQNNGGMNKDELRSIFEESGADETDLETFDRVYDEVVGKGKELLPENVLNASKLEIKTEEAVVSAKLGDGSSIETKVVDGVRCLVLPLNGICSINGLKVS